MMSSFGNNDDEGTTTRYSGSSVFPDLFTEEEIAEIAAAGTVEESRHPSRLQRARRLTRRLK